MSRARVRLPVFRLRLSLLMCVAAGPAAAHGTERAFVLLLPTEYYLFGGTAAVAASFLLVALVPAGLAGRLACVRLRIATLPALDPLATSLASFILLCGLVAAGLYGTRDPLANPLPLAIWTVWWVGVTLLHPLVGNLWHFINPWSGPYRVVDRVSGGRLSRAARPYPAWLGYAPAFACFSGFAWLELVYPAPDDPERLAIAVALYWLAAFAGMLVFGERAWRERGEPFSIFFRLIGGLSPFVVEPIAGETRRMKLSLAVPGAALVTCTPLPLSGVLFVLLTLSAVSFDGLSKTFWWLSLWGINPLEFPGRSALVIRNSLGLVAAFGVLAAAYAGAIWIGLRLAGEGRRFREALGASVYAIMPISIAFHFAHYLTALIVDGQYAVIAASDPFGTGLDLLGVSDAHVTTSFLNTYEGVRRIWNLQTAAIVLGHTVALALAFMDAARRSDTHREAVVSQVPLAVLMVLYTLFGLWLLSTPVAV